jgi:hypothetical protein
MQIILRRTKCFSEGQQTLTLSPLPGVQTVPDWVRNTGTFQLGCLDQSIQEVEVKSAPAPAEAAPVQAARPAQPPMQAEAPAAPQPQFHGKNRK